MLSVWYSSKLPFLLVMLENRTSAGVVDPFLKHLGISLFLKVLHFSLQYNLSTYCSLQLTIVRWNIFLGIWTPGTLESYFVLGKRKDLLKRRDEKNSTYWWFWHFIFPAFWVGGASWPLSSTAQSNFFLRITGSGRELIRSVQPVPSLQKSNK